MKKLCTYTALALMMIATALAQPLPEFLSSTNQTFYEAFNGTTFDLTTWAVDGGVPIQNDNITLKADSGEGGQQWNDNVTWINSNFTRTNTTNVAIKWTGHIAPNYRIMVCLVDSTEHWGQFGSTDLTKLDYCMYEGVGDNIDAYEEGVLAGNSAFSFTQNGTNWFKWNISNDIVSYWARTDETTTWTNIHNSSQSLGNKFSLVIDVGADTSHPYIFDDIQVWNNEGQEAPPPPDPIVATWDTQSPLNNTIGMNPLTFYYNLSGVSGTASCSLLTNETYLTANATGLGNGTQSLTVDPLAYMEIDLAFRINCTDTYNATTTTTKVITQDTIGDIYWQGYAPQNYSILTDENTNATFYYNISHFNQATCDFTVNGAKTTSASNLVNNTQYSFQYDTPQTENTTATFQINCTDDTYGYIQAISTTKTLRIVTDWIDWITETPLNTTTLFKKTNFTYTLKGVENIDNCTLYNSTAQVGYTDTPTNHYIEYTPTTNTTYTDTYYIQCQDETYGTDTTLQKTITVDTAPPIIIATTPNQLNTTIVDDTLTLNIQIQDTSNFNALYNITNSIGETQAHNLTLNISAGTFTFNDVIDVSGWDAGIYTIEISGGDVQ